MGATSLTIKKTMAVLAVAGTTAGMVKTGLSTSMTSNATHLASGAVKVGAASGLATGGTATSWERDGLKEVGDSWSSTGMKMDDVYHHPGTFLTTPSCGDSDSDTLSLSGSLADDACDFILNTDVSDGASSGWTMADPAILALGAKVIAAGLGDELDTALEAEGYSASQQGLRDAFWDMATTTVTSCSHEIPTIVICGPVARLSTATSLASGGVVKIYSTSDSSGGGSVGGLSLPGSIHTTSCVEIPCEDCGSSGGPTNDNDVEYADILNALEWLIEGDDGSDRLPGAWYGHDGYSSTELPAAQLALAFLNWGTASVLTCDSGAWGDGVIVFSMNVEVDGLDGGDTLADTIDGYDVYYGDTTDDAEDWLDHLKREGVTLEVSSLSVLGASGAKTIKGDAVSDLFAACDVGSLIDP